MIFASLLLAVAISFAGVACAGTPNIMTIQGKAVSKAAGLLTAGNVSIRVYNSQAGSTEVYSENFTNIISNGTFSVTIGNTTDMNLTYNDRYWVEISINNEEVVGNETQGRRPFVAAAGPQSSIFYVNETSGMVGIGTTAPAEKLDISGGIQVAGNIYPSSDQIYSLGTPSKKFGSLRAMYWRHFDSDNYVIGAAAYGNWFIRGEGDATHEAISLIDLGSGKGLSILGNGDTYISGNVGIGTTGPGAKLEVLGNAIIGNGTNGSGVNSLTISGGNSAGDEAQLLFGASSYGKIIYDSSTAGLSLSVKHAVGYIRFLTGSTPTEYMQITPGGNVGIGTTGPSNTLHVNGTLRVENTTGTIGLFQSAAGNVGIGTTSPDYKLQVNGNIAGGATSQDFYIQHVQAYNSYIRFSYPGPIFIRGQAGITLFTIGAGDISIAPVSGNVTIVPVSGNVGIGTTSPSQKLEVNGNLLVNSTSYPSAFFVNSSSGNVGIGTTTPQNKLDVVGTINATGNVTIAQNNRFCLTQGCTKYIYYNGTHTVIQG